MINGLTFGELTVGVDPRGVVREFFRRSRGGKSGIPEPREGWAQINVTESNYGAVRGLHAEETNKLVGIVTSEAFGVWIDARPESGSFGEMVTTTLYPGTQVYVPAGVLNGWQSLSNPSQYLYCFSSEWTPDIKGIWVNPLDPKLGVPWPVHIEVGN
ncbi:MAG: dTDP-4-dehydrorhamnose 3,5-epimerase family protein [Acidimicrobiales bacterium]